MEDGPELLGIAPYFSGITAAVKYGLLNESTVREAIKPLFYTRMRLGLFDPAPDNPFAQLDPLEVRHFHPYAQVFTSIASIPVTSHCGTTSK